MGLTVQNLVSCFLGWAGRVVTGVVVGSLRLCGVLVYVALWLGEPVVRIVFSSLAFFGFWIAILFGFILQMPFPHRWDMLGMSVLCLLIYGLYLGMIRCLQRYVI